MTAERILFITPQPYFMERGSPYRVRAEVQAILAQGFEVDLLSYPFGTELPMKGVTHYRSLSIPGITEVPIGWSWRKLLLDVSLFFSALRLLLSRRYAVVHGVEDAGVMAALLSIFFRTPFIFDMHSQMSEQLSQCVIREGSWIHRQFVKAERWCMNRASGIITVSDAITARARAIAPHVPAMTLEDLALGGVDEVDAEQVSEIRSKLQLNGRPLAVYTGNFEPYQGIDLLLNGFAELMKLHDSQPPAGRPMLLVVGGGHSNDPRMLHYLRICSELQLDGDVIFAGQQPEAAMSSFMSMAEVLVSPRIAGAHTPLKIYTYMAATKPIVATRITSHTNVLNDENAFLAEAEPISFSRALLEAFDQDPLQRAKRDARVERALRLLQKRFSRAEFERRMGVLYRAVRGESLSEEVLMSPETLELRQQQQSWG